MIKAVIFDFDGTLSNRQENAYGVFEYYFRPYFKDMSDLEFEAVLQNMMIYDQNGTVPVSTRLITFKKKYEKYLPDDFEEKFVPYYIDHMHDFTVLKKETIDVLEKLQGKYKLAIMSNGDSKSQHSKIKHVDIEKYFDEVLVSGDIDIHKPDKAIFEYMADKLSVKCEECLMVGDVFANDIFGAINAGMVPVWILEDKERPAHYYKGYRIEKLDEIFNILDILNKQ